MRSPSGLSSCSWAQALYVSAGAKLLTGLHVPCQKTAKQVLSQLAHLMRDAGSTIGGPGCALLKLPAELNHRWWFSATEGWLRSSKAPREPVAWTDFALS
jgi:hypothetical protein